MKTLLVTRRVWKIANFPTACRVYQDRVRRGLSLREVGKRMGLSVSYLSDLERGRRNWTAELVRRYEEAVK